MISLLAWVQYSLRWATCKGRYLLAAVLILAGSGLSAAELEIRSGPGRVGPLAWQQVDIVYRPETADQAGSWRMHASGLEGPDAMAIGSVELECRAGRMRPAGPECDAGSLTWIDGPVLDELKADFRLVADEQVFEMELLTGPVQGWMRSPRNGEGPSLALTIDALPLAQLPVELFEDVGLRDLAGELSGSIDFADGRLQGQARLDDAGFDSAGGEYAGFGLVANGTFELVLGEDDIEFSATLEQSAGELLFGQIYLPSPTEPLSLDMRGRSIGAERWQIDALEIEDPGALSFAGSLALKRDEEEAWSLDWARAASLELEFPLAWERWLDGPLAAKGLAGVESLGRIRATGRIDGADMRLEASVDGFYLDDPQERFAISGVTADITIDDDYSSVVIEWDSLALYGLPSGASSLRLAGDGMQIGLVEPLRLPILDGAVVVERLLWEYADVEDRELLLDARIEPLDLAELTELLGFPEFGGELSGSFPGVRYVDEVLTFTGGIDVRAFSGQIELRDLAIERPFGTLPALAAQVDIHRLDLAEVTGAFNFGHMEGQLSGWMHDLRLLDWRPVAMDARIHTHDDARRRRISQRAVENLSNLGGAGGALITGTVLRIFDEFPYRRAGLACRLSNNICHIDGVAPHDSGGFYIIQGRSLPRLDIIGHRRLVDWPQLMRQLAAMMEE